MGAFANPISVGGGLSGRTTSTRLRRREDPQRVGFYAQTLDVWQDYVSGLIERVALASVTETMRVAAKNKLRMSVVGVEALHVASAAESEEMRWLTENSRRLEAYRGEWLLIRGQELVAHSANFRDIRTTIAERNIRSPFVYYVPTLEESDFISI